MGRLDSCRLIDLPEIVDPRGSLTFAEHEAHVPFPIARVFYLYGVPEGGVRGGHAHHGLHQVMMAVSGSFDVVLDDGFESMVQHLNRPSVGLYVPPMIWREMKNFSAHAVQLVLASLPYSANDYIRDQEAFYRLAREREA